MDLFEAARMGATARVRALLAAGADVDKVNIDDPNHRGATALMEAIRFNHPAVERLLRDAKGIRARHLLKKWRAATRLWRITNYWWRVAVEGLFAPGAPGHLAAVAHWAHL